MSLLTIISLGAFVRYWLLTSDYRDTIADRVEVSTPLNAWKRVVEGVHLINSNIDPYSGDLLHEPPANLMVYKILLEYFPELIHWVFIVCDVLTAVCLYNVAKKHVKELKSKKAESKLKCNDDGSDIPSYVIVAYLFNPFTVFNCVGCTTTVFTNMFLSLSLMGMMTFNPLLTAAPLAICASQNLYPFLLVSPIFLRYWNTDKKLLRPLTTSLGVLVFWQILVQISSYLDATKEYLHDTYGFILTVPDLRPNIGLFWYFFIEMFEHFRSLFIYSFQINISLLYLIPLSLRFRKEPLLLGVSLLSLVAIFKSYPCLGDVGFVLGLIPCWKHLFTYVQQGFFIICCLFVTTILAPTVWYLWIYSGSANANFYFGVTLAFATAQIFLITNILFAQTKYEFNSIHGPERKIDGKDAVLVLE